jgi:hypothetical protein
MVWSSVTCTPCEMPESERRVIRHNGRDPNISGERVRSADSACGNLTGTRVLAMHRTDSICYKPPWGVWIRLHVRSM